MEIPKYIEGIPTEKNDSKKDVKLSKMNTYV